MNDKSCVSNKNKDARLVSRHNYATPAVDIFEQDGELTLLADMPGVTTEQLQIDIDQGLLTIEAVAEASSQGDALSREFGPSGYYRQFRLPEHIDLNQVDAQLNHGVLSLKLPKSAEALPKRIEVKTVH